MRKMFARNMTWFAPTLILVSMIWLGGFCAASMDHGSVIHENHAMAVIGGVDCSQSASASTCASVHMGILQEVAYAIPGNIDFGMGLIGMVSLAILLFGSVREKDEAMYTLHRVRYRKRLEKTIDSFSAQLLRWLSLVKKTDCAYCLS